MDTTAAAPPLSPQALALAYDRFVSARWRGEDEVADAFAAWFEAHWTGQAPPEPDSPPAAASILGGAGTGIRWYALEDSVLGYVGESVAGCYRVSPHEIAPVLLDPWQATQTDRLLGQTVVAPITGRAAMSASEEPAGGRRIERSTIAARGSGQRSRRPNAPAEQNDSAEIV
jgi:hypothetical protein